MDPGEKHGADWRDAAAYAPLLDADRSILAWEWLRRDPAYRAAARTALESQGLGKHGARPAAWGLHAFEPPERAAPHARPVWRADVHPYVVQARACRPETWRDAFDLDRFAHLARVVAGADGHQHLLIADGLRFIRLDIVEGSLTRGPMQLHYLLAGFASAEPPLLTVRRLLALQRRGRFSRSLHPREARARRWGLVLRAADALAAGADQREIAAFLLSRSANEPRWRSRESSTRSQAQRLVRTARHMAAGGYRAFLR